MSDTQADTNEATETEAVEMTPFERGLAKLQEGMTTETEDGLGESQESAETEGEQGEAEASQATEASETQAETEGEPVQAGEADTEVPLKARQLAILQRYEQEHQEKLKALDSQVEAKAQELFQGYLKQLQANPAMLREAGIDDLGGYAAQLWNMELGEDAPEEFRQQLKERSLEAKISALEKRLEEREQQPPAPDPRVTAVAGEIQGFVQAIPDDMPLLRQEFEDNPQETLEAFGRLGDMYIAQGQLPNAQLLAQELETHMRAELEKRAQVLGYKTASTEEEKPPQGTKKAKKALSDAETKQKPDRKNTKALTKQERLARGIEALKRGA